MLLRTKPGRPMRKWCHECDQFKDNPEGLKNPKYCLDCLEARNNKRWKQKKNERNI